MRKPPAALVAAAALLSLASATLSAPASAAGVRLVPPAAAWRAPVLAHDDETDATATPAWLQFGYGPGHTGDNPLETILTPQNVSTLQLAWNDTGIIQPGGIVVDHGVAYVDDMGQSNAGFYALDATTGKQKWFAPLNLNGPWGGFSHAVAAVGQNVVVSPCSDGQSDFQNGVCGVSKKTGKVLWTHYCTEYMGSPCGGLPNGGTSPALYRDRIYLQIVEGVNEQPDTEALDPKTGARVWDAPGVYHCPDAGDTSGDPIPAANGLVFAVAGCQGPQGATEFCAYSPSTGSTAWCDASATAYIESLMTADGKLFVAEPGTSNLTVVAVDAKTGASSWTATLPGTNGARFAAANGRLFVSEYQNGIFALATSSGKALWSNTANGHFTAGGTLSVANGVVYTNGFGGNNGDAAIFALSAKNGSVISTSPYGNGAAPATPVILDGRVYAGCYTMCAFALPGARRF